MIRLSYLSGSLAGTAGAFEKRSVRIGTSGDCDVRYDAAQDPAVARYHAAVMRRDDAYHLMELGPPGGLWVNGSPVRNHRLRTGDRIRLGGPEGPEIEVSVVLDPSYDAAHDAARMVEVFRGKTRETSALRIVKAAADRVAEARAAAGGTRSRRTLELMAETFHEVGNLVRRQTRRRWAGIAGAVGGVALIIIAGLGLVIWNQQRQIRSLLDAKGRFDEQIRAIQARMEVEQDPLRLEWLEGQLLRTTANAERTLADLARTDRRKAEEVLASEDELDREIREILRQFDAETYAVPPIFRERLAFHIDRLVRAREVTLLIYRRKVKYWPEITREFRALELPEAMAYVAWTESQFDPVALSSAGARGMWQMTRSTAQALGLRVDGAVDERTNVSLQTRAAARHLAGLLGEFGEDAFMLAMASYNKGENGVRRVLREVARTPGGFKKSRRDFWHLYRLRLLPEETREYVPKILAAAIVSSHPEKYGLLTPADTVAHP